jgi:hypothetical protein
MLTNKHIRERRQLTAASQAVVVLRLKAAFPSSSLWLWVGWQTHHADSMPMRMPRAKSKRTMTMSLCVLGCGAKKGSDGKRCEILDVSRESR